MVDSVFRQQDCENIFAEFEQEARQFYSPEMLEEGGVWTKDRQEEMRFHSILSLSIGVVKTNSALCNNHHQVAEMAAKAKKLAKQKGGNSLYIHPCCECD